MRLTALAATAALAGLVGGCAEGSDGKKGACGVEGGSEFEIVVLGATIFPYKPETESPWDWDGDIPDWMIDVTDALAGIVASPELKTAAEILELVDEYGPLLLEGTVPPDPILQVVAALDTATTTTTSTTFGGTTYTTTYGSVPRNVVRPHPLASRRSRSLRPVEPTDSGFYSVDVRVEAL